MNVLDGEPKDHQGVVFAQDAFTRSKGVELDPASKQLVLDYPELVARLTYLEGVRNLADDDRQVVQRTELELWSALETMEPDKARQTVDCISRWERLGQPPLDADFTYDEVQIVKKARNESQFAGVIFDILPGRNRHPDSIVKQIGEKVLVSPEYL